MLSASAVASANAVAMLTWRSEIASTKQNSANAAKPLTRPRSRRRSSSVPRWAWVNVASTVAMMGNGVSRPLSCGPSQPAMAVNVSTSASAHAARMGRSHAGGVGWTRGSTVGRGSSASPPSRPAPAIASAAVAGTERALNASVASAKASQPASRPIAQ